MSTRCVWVVGLAMVSVALSGCATVLGSGGKERVKVTSEPSDAVIRIDSEVRGRTPETFYLSTEESHVILVEKTCFEYASVSTGQKAEVGWMILDGIFALPTLGLTVGIDYATSAYFTFRRHEVAVDLVKKESCSKK